jgi:hypothetical protein
MDFGQALAALKDGKRVTRAGWNGKGQFLYLVPGSTFEVNRPPLLGIYPEGTEIRYLPHIDLRTADGSCAPWSATGTDLLADDWLVAAADERPPACNYPTFNELRAAMGLPPAGISPPPDTHSHVHHSISHAEIERAVVHALTTVCRRYGWHWPPR